jgi:hypothetical protein
MPSRKRTSIRTAYLPTIRLCPEREAAVDDQE